MKFVWETSDLRPGRRVQTAARTEEFVIGHSVRGGGGDPRFQLTSLRDGQVYFADSDKITFVNNLNRNEARPVTIEDENGGMIAGS